jgi:peptidoglycan/xylan/chitin deacetylase (PgdA/CDA1 family)
MVANTTLPFLFVQDGPLVGSQHSVARFKVSNTKPNAESIMNHLVYNVAHITALMRDLMSSRHKCLLGTRVLMFHDINIDQSREDVYSLPSNTFADFAKQLRSWADANGIQIRRFSHEPLPGVAVTFDDGYSSTLTHAAEHLNDSSIPFHVFVTKQFVESSDSKYLAPKDVVELSDMHLTTLGVHGVSHSRLSQLSHHEIRRELHDSQRWLEDLIGRPVTTASYPHGDYNDSVIEIMKELGFNAVACSNVGTFTSSGQRFVIPRVDVWALDSASTILQKTRGSWDHVLS